MKGTLEKLGVYSSNFSVIKDRQILIRKRPLKFDISQVIFSYQILTEGLFSYKISTL